MPTLLSILRIPVKNTTNIHSRVSNTNYGPTADGQQWEYLQTVLTTYQYNIGISEYSSIYPEQGDLKFAGNCFDQQVTSIVTGQNSEILVLYF
jgi:hypothetical protein